MKHIIVFILLLFIPCTLFCQVKVKGYYRKDGTYVRPHYRSSPNHTKLDNWSTKGNVNPYTGKVGNKKVYETTPQSVCKNSSSANVSTINTQSFDDNPKLKSIREKAESGDKYSQYNMGSRYFYGDGIRQDYKKAFHWYMQSARQGLKEAQYNVGYCYYTGKGIDINITESVYWLKKASENGDVNAKFLLGRLYYEGKGIAKNKSKGIELLRISYRDGCAKAGEYLNKKGISLVSDEKKVKNDVPHKSEGNKLLFRSGVSLSKFHKQDVNNLPRPWFGLFADFLVSHKFGVQMGLMYITKGAREFDNVYIVNSKSDLGLMCDYNLSYIEMPVVFYDRLHISDNAEFRLGFGTYISYAISGNLDIRALGKKVDLSFDVFDDDFAEKIDLGGRVELAMKIKRWLLTFDYDFGMNIANKGNITKLMGYNLKLRNNSMIMGLGFVF